MIDNQNGMADHGTRAPTITQSLRGTMHNVRRTYVPGAYYFVTAVTFGRKPCLTANYDLFRLAWKRQSLMAWVLLPDHFHALLVPAQGNIAVVMHRFKITFSRAYRDRHGAGRVWQNRYWDHIIRHERDFKQHLDYIHFNPVKHNLVRRPLDYEYSSFQSFLTRGWYDEEWAHLHIEPESDFGE